MKLHTTLFLTFALVALGLPVLAQPQPSTPGPDVVPPTATPADPQPATAVPPTEPTADVPADQPVQPAPAELPTPRNSNPDDAQVSPGTPNDPQTLERTGLLPVDAPNPQQTFGALGALLQGVLLPQTDHDILTGRIQNVFLWRNDQDFDRTAPLYNAQGQDVGVLGTFIAPKLEIQPHKALRVVWESEIGLNLWSMQDSDQYQMDGDKSFRLAVRQLYSEGKFLDGGFGFRVGYEQLFDPTGLFLGHWLGAASVSTCHDWGKLTLTLAQIPDLTYEGASYDANNFNSDTFAYGLRYDATSGALGFSGSVWGLHDTQVVGQEMNLMVATAQFSGKWTRFTALLDAGVQYGVTDHRAAGADETTLAWAAQASASLNQPLSGDELALVLHANVVALSGDDNYDGNDQNGAWFYSGKNRSRTLLLTEDELRDRGGNLDEQLAERRQGDNGKFYAVRPGLVVADLSIGLDVDHFFRPMATLGAGFALNPENSLGSGFVGFESDLHLEFYFENLLSFDLVGSFLQPGEAAAAFVNRGIDRSATDPILQVEAVLTLRF